MMVLLQIVWVSKYWTILLSRLYCQVGALSPNLTMPTRGRIAYLFLYLFTRLVTDPKFRTPIKLNKLIKLIKLIK